MREADSKRANDSAEPPVEREVLSLARLLHYALREAESLGQLEAVALIDAALLSLRADNPTSARETANLSTSGDRLGDTTPGELTRAH